MYDVTRRETFEGLQEVWIPEVAMYRWEFLHNSQTLQLHLNSGHSTARGTLQQRLHIPSRVLSFGGELCLTYLIKAALLKQLLLGAALWSIQQPWWWATKLTW